MESKKKIFKRELNEFLDKYLVTTDLSVPAIAQPEQPKPITDERIRAERYEFVRTLNPRQFTELWTRNINDQGFFDDLVDAAMAKGSAK